MADSIRLTEDDIFASEQYQDLWTDNLALEEEKAYLENLVDQYESSAVTIFDIEDFMYRLRQDNLLTEELENFIKVYMKYYNDTFRPKGDYYYES